MDIRIASDRNMIRYAVWRNFIDAVSTPDVMDFPQTAPPAQRTPYNPEEQYETEKPVDKDIRLLKNNYNLKQIPPVGDPSYKGMASYVIKNKDIYPEIAKLIKDPADPMMMTSAKVQKILSVMTNPNPQQLAAFKSKFPRWVAPQNVQQALVYLKNPEDFNKVVSIASFGNENLMQEVEPLAKLLDPAIVRNATNIQQYVSAVNQSFIIGKLASDMAELMKPKPTPSYFSGKPDTTHFGPWNKSACRNREPIQYLMLRNAVISRYLDSMEA